MKPMLGPKLPEGRHARMTKHPSLRPVSIAAELAAHHEGLSLDPYHDPVGFPTIGYGHAEPREGRRPVAVRAAGRRGRGGFWKRILR